MCLQKSTSPDLTFILARILFLCTASGPSYIQSLVEDKRHGRTVVDIISAKLESLLVNILNGQRMAKEAMTDVLKFAFNILMHYPKVRPQIQPMVCIRPISLTNYSCASPASRL